MKKYIIPLIVLLFASCSEYRIYSVKDSPLAPVSGGVVYALPKTQLAVSVTVERRDVSKAPYFKYAEDYLGVSASDIDTLFHIVDIDVSGVNVADPDHFYYVDVRRGSLTVDRRHLLLAIGVDNDEMALKTLSADVASDDVTAPTKRQANGALRGEYNLYDRADTLYTRYDAPGRPTLVSTRKDVRTVKQRAAAAAERIGELQERMQQLLNGEYEGAYGAEAVEYLYERLKTQENELMSQFCGEVKRETVTFFVEPVMKRRMDFADTVIWFSETEGFVGGVDHLPADATPVVCSVHNDNDMRMTGRFVKYHTSGVTQKGDAGRTGTAAARSRKVKGFRYRVPEMVSVSISTSSLSLSRQVAVSQMGPTVALPRHRVKALFDANTLDLKYFSRK